MLLIPVLFTILFIWLIFTILNQYHYNNNRTYDCGSGYSVDKSLQILRERYARGEISDEDFERIKRNLER